MTTAHEVLARLTAAGVTLTVDGDRLIASSPASLTDAHRAAIRQAKPDLLALLAAERQEAVAEATAERAAVVEYLGGLSRTRAQEVAEVAGLYYAHAWSCAACRDGTVTGAMLHRPCPEGAALWERYCQVAGREARP